MPGEIDQYRRRFLGAAAVTIAASQLGTAGSASAQSGSAKPDVPTIKPGTNTAFAPLKQIDADRTRFSGRYQHRIIDGGIGHNLPQEAPQAFAQAVVDVAN